MTGAAFRIIAAGSAADLQAVAWLSQAYAASLAIDLAYQDFATELATLPGKYAPPAGALLLARGSGDEPLGCVALRPLALDGSCEMKRLYVSPWARGLGLGRALVEASIGRAALIGYRELRLDTLPGMGEAQALYRRAGFVPVEPYYDTPIAGTVFLVRSLGGRA